MLTARDKEYATSLYCVKIIKTIMVTYKDAYWLFALHSVYDIGDIQI